MGLIPKTEPQTILSSPGAQSGEHSNGCISEENEVGEISTEGILELKEG